MATPSLHDKVLQEFWIGSKLIYFRNLGWIRDPEGVIMHRVLCGVARATLSHCAGVVALVSCRRDLHNLEVGFVVFIINACAGA
jgi:hypothetical protein